MKREQPIPQPTEGLKAKYLADNQFSKFAWLFRAVMAVPKSEVPEREAKEKHRNARVRARKQKRLK